MFLWREDDDKLENVFLDIAKHRNGAVGQIQLYFKGDRIRYYGLEHKHS
jgi:replicative DNA helicase